ncbi:hypothetical protein [Haladaptatus sp. NG-SE-30]
MRRVLALTVLLLLVPVVGPSMASPQPTPVCQLCGSVFADAAEDGGINATVTNSTVVVRTHENGSATWVVRNRLSDGADRFRENPVRLNRLAQTLLDERYGLVDDATLVSTRMDSEVAVITIRDDDAATHHAGVLVVDYLHDGGYETWYVLNVDRFTIRGPDGTVVSNEPESGSVDGRSVTWYGETEPESYSAPSLEGSPYVAFGADDSLTTQMRTTGALALATLPIVVRSVRSFLLWQTVLFTVVLGGVVGLLRTYTPSVDGSRLAAITVALGAVGTVAFGTVVLRSTQFYPALGPPLFGVTVGLVAWETRTRETRQRRYSGARIAIGGLVFAFAGTTVVAGVTSAPNPIETAIRATAIALPLAALLPLGATLDANRRRLLRWGALAVVAFAAFPPAFVDFSDPPTGLGGGLLTVFVFVIAVLLPLVGTVVLLVGQSFASPQRSGETR